MDKKFIIEAARLQKLAGIKEIKIGNPNIGFNPSHPQAPRALLSFIKSNKAAILQHISQQQDPYNGDINIDLGEKADIYDFNDTIVDDDNYIGWIFNEEPEFKELYPGAAEYSIRANGGEAMDCRGVLICNLDPELWEHLVSGISYNDLNFRDIPNLYYEFVDC